jgi:putative nucleotidyltransferase with HDIG domain
MKRLIFVDDEPRVLDGLRRMLYRLRDQWDMEFVTSGYEALERLSHVRYDAIITDIHMPEMGGVELLEEVLRRHPSVIRVVLSGTADYAATLPAVTLAHQYLVKPCDAEALRSTLERALSPVYLPSNPRLQEMISSLPNLPSLPTVYRELIEALDSEESSAQNIGEIISRDVGMSAKILQLVNSAYFGVQRKIRHPAEAVIYLGADSVRALALTVSVFSAFDQKRAGQFSIATVNQHSLTVGGLAQSIAKFIKLPKTDADDVFAGGLLHDVGKLVIACSHPDLYESVICAGRELYQAQREVEMRVFGATHAEIGAYLLWLWGLPESTVKTVSLHHTWPSAGDVPGVAVATVQAADAISHDDVPDAIRKWLQEVGCGETLLSALEDYGCTQQR